MCICSIILIASKYPTEKGNFRSNQEEWDIEIQFCEKQLNLLWHLVFFSRKRWTPICDIAEKLIVLVKIKENYENSSRLLNQYCKIKERRCTYLNWPRTINPIYFLGGGYPMKQKLKPNKWRVIYVTTGEIYIYIFEGCKYLTIRCFWYSFIM